MQRTQRTMSMLAAAALMTTTMAGLAIGQADMNGGPHGPHPMDRDGGGRGGPPRPHLGPAVALEGTVTSYNHGARGEIDGFLLDADGKTVQVNLPPPIGSMVTTFAPLAKSVKILASKPEGPSGPGGPGGPDGPERHEHEGPPHEAADHDVYEFRGLDTGKGAPSTQPALKVDGHVEGTIKSLNYARRGEVDGATLDTGDFVHVGPREAKNAALKVGDKLTADGPVIAMDDGHQALDADKLNGKTIDHPPRPGEREGGDHRPTPPQ